MSIGIKDDDFGLVSVGKLEGRVFLQAISHWFEFPPMFTPIGFGNDKLDGALCCHTYLLYVYMCWVVCPIIAQPFDGWFASSS